MVKKINGEGRERGMHITVPGRTELAGNHTDHQGGHVLAAAINLFVHGEAEATDNGKISLASEGFGVLEVSLSETDREYSAAGSAEALVRGTVEYLLREGYAVRGFRGSLRSEIPVGAGLSSSAAFSVWVGKTVSLLFHGGTIPPLTLALAAQYAENHHFGKPCGLMDQCACACGGITEMDFSAPIPKLSAVKTNPTELGYALYVVDTGGSHRDLTEAYAAIPDEMRQVAACFGKSRLSELAESEFRSSIPMLRGRVTDRAIIRAVHYYEEDRRVLQMSAALAENDMREYLHLMDESGRSSAELLQNQFYGAERQGIPLALALSRRVLGGKGAARVHGGGFAGTIQALMPEELAPRFETELSAVFGKRCIRLSLV